MNDYQSLRVGIRHVIIFTFIMEIKTTIGFKISNLTSTV